MRFAPAKLSRIIRKSSKDTCVNCGLPAHSPIAQTSGALVSRRSLTLMYPRLSNSTPAASEPDLGGVGSAPCRDQDVTALNGLLT